MAKASPIQSSFNAGELSPTIEGRTDLAKYAAGCTKMENFFPLVPGAVRKRSGTRFVKEVKDVSKATRLIPFEFGTDQAYILEFGDQYMRAYRNGGPVLEAGYDDSTAVTGGKLITFATTASPIVVTSPGHRLQNDAKVTITGMTGITSDVNDKVFVVSARTDDTFALTGSSTSATYVSGGVATPMQHISATTNATPVVVTLPGHGLVDNDQVFISDTGLASLDNRYWVVNQLTADTFELNGSSAPGATAQKTVTATSHATPVRVTSAGHGFNNLDYVYIAGTGRAEIDDQSWYVSSVTEDTFTLLDSVGAGASTSTATACPGRSQRVFTLTTPFLEAGLDKIQIAQSADVLYIAHPDRNPRKLIRYNHDAWSLDIIEFDFVPFSPTNLDETITVLASAVTGDGITLTATGGSVFSADMIGGQFRLSEIIGSNHGRWEAVSKLDNYARDGTASVGAEFYYDGNVYELKNLNSEGKTGTSAPIHEFGTELDGTWSWEYLHSGDGYVTITAVASGTSATADVVKQLPKSVTAATTHRWAHGAWTGRNGYPSSVTFFEDRLWWAGTAGDPQTLWASQTSDYENHKIVDLDESALIFTINTDQVNVIEWINAGKVLVAGTAGGEFVVSASSESEALVAGNVRVVRHSTYGSKGNVNPQRVGESLLFAQRAGRKLREFVYDDTVGSYVAPDMTVLADHITLGGLTRLAYQQEPNRIVWATLADGQLLGFTFDREQQVTAWHRHVIGGTDAKVESIAVIPHPDGDQDQLWMIVNRKIGGTETRHIEYLESEWVRTNELDEAFFVDSGLTLDNVVPATNATITATGQASCGIFLAHKSLPAVIVTNAVGLSYSFAASVKDTGLENGTLIDIEDVVGMTELNGRRFEVHHASSPTSGRLDFSLVDPSVTRLTALITNITTATPSVVTALGHGFSSTDVVYISGVVGMTNVNDGYYNITVTDDDTFSLEESDDDPFSGTGTYSSGGIADRISDGYVDSSNFGTFVAGSPETSEIRIATTSITGLDHLEGETVSILANGATHADKTVSGGAITLDVAASTVQVGLGYDATLQTMRLDAGAADGTSQGKTKRFTNVVLRLDQTGSGLYYGATDVTADMDELHLRDGNDPMDTPVPLFNGDTEILPWPAGYEKAGRLTLKHTLPQPCTVIAIMPQVATQDR